MKRAVFFDRDGVVNEPIVKDGKPFSPRQLHELHIMHDAEICLRRLREAGFLNIVVTNQPEISRGMLDKDVLDAMHERLQSTLPIDGVLVCPHDDKDNCPCRKPKPGMLLAAAHQWGLHLAASFMVGDRWKDIAAGREAGCCTVLIDYPYNSDVQSDHRAKSLTEATEFILSNGVAE